MESTTVTTEPLTVLLVEDDPADAARVEQCLDAGNPGAFCVSRVGSLQLAVEALEQDQGIALVLVDLSLPDAAGPESVVRIRERRPGTPVLVLTDLDDEATAVRAVQCGAQDYLVKGRLQPRFLVRSIHYAVERQRLVEKLELARQSESELRDRLLSHVSHELRTPLNAIQQFASILRDGLAGETSEQQSTYLEIVLRNVRELDGMIDDLIAVTRAYSGRIPIRRQLVEIERPIARAMENVAANAERENIELQSDFAARLPRVVVDPDRLCHVIVRLIDNAVAFSPPNGQVVVSAVNTPNGAVRITVADDGPGVPDADLEAVFDPLHQVEGARRGSRKGLGLGLFLARQVVNELGGRLWTDKESGAGGRFHLELPGFPLAAPVRDVFRVDDRAPPALAIVAISIAPTSGQVSTAIVDAVVETLSATVALDSGVVLPAAAPDSDPTIGGAATETLFVLARAAVPEIEGIAKRVRQAVGESASGWSDHCSMTVAHAFVETVVEQHELEDAAQARWSREAERCIAAMTNRRSQP